ncbi:MAG: elongation factor 4 [Xanthomonadaceae bacterium]|nr:elongation factor 4 [Rhodospirillaceae bacterium]NIA18009.1 elongation factor 4 [Xanthomonadaceae bacterium]
MVNIRNFSIIAHIDHGKSTLADRFLELTGTVEKRKMKEQLLDQMDLERERGITIKLQPVRMEYHFENPSSSFAKGGNNFILNLIDTPGHVDFSYEVSRSLAAVESTILLVDATQGIQAQTLANLYLALEQNLEIIPVINKIDLPAANIKKVKKEIINLIGCDEKEILLVSAKTGEGVEEVLQEVIKKTPPPKKEKNGLQALIFDSIYDEYKGVIAYVRIVDGNVKIGDKIITVATKAEDEVLEVGYFKPHLVKANKLSAGEIGYIIAGFKSVSDCRVGDTITNLKIKNEKLKTEPLPGYKEVKPMVFSDIFCKEGNDYAQLREAIDKLKLNDAALSYEPEHSPALGYGLRCGFLGMLHLDIVQERLKREYNLDLIITVPSVKYRVKKKDKTIIEIRNPQELPRQEVIEYIEEPIMNLDIVTPKDYIGAIMGLVQERHGIYKNTEYLDKTRAILHYEIPLTSLLVNFYDKLKSISSGYASLNYEFLEFRKTEVVKLDILIAEEIEESLSSIVYKDEAFKVGKQIVNSLKKTIPKQMFVIKIQAVIGGKIIAAERLSAMRKDVTAKLYGGDVTRKRKLLEKQKKGKKKMMAMGKGKVDIPTEAFMAVLKR